MVQSLLRGVQAKSRIDLSRLRSLGKDPSSFDLLEAQDTIALEEGFLSWPDLASSCANGTAERRRRIRRLRIALFHGQDWKTDQLLRSDPTLAHENLGIEIALFDADSAIPRIETDPSLATENVSGRAPILHLCFSRRSRASPDADAAVAAILETLLANGADPNESMPFPPEPDHRLSALYGAVGHAGNLPLAKRLLEQGADPNDNESLYHATELGHSDGVRLLLSHGAEIEGTNALLRALDFNSHESVGLMLAHGADPNSPVADHPSGEAPMVIPAIHQAARRQCDRKMAQMLLDAGADPDRKHSGHTAYGVARIYGNWEIAEEIAARGGSAELDGLEQKLVQIADGQIPPGFFIRPEDLSDECRGLMTNLVAVPGRLPHMQRLAECGFDTNEADGMECTPLHLAGWEGLKEPMEWLLTLGPDLGHVNGFGGNLLSTVIHGSENCPARSQRDHVGCAELALRAGVGLSTRSIELAGEETMAVFLKEWADAHPDDVIEGGIG